MATLNDVTKKARTLADTISKRVASKAPVKTGNLKRRLIAANTIDTMLEITSVDSKTKMVKGIEISYNYAPDGAEYGRYWNDPTVSDSVRNQKTGNKDKINFAEKGLNDSKVNDKIDELLDILGDTTLAQIDVELSLMESEY
jgi:hypothetical protein